MVETGELLIFASATGFPMPYTQDVVSHPKTPWANNNLEHVAWPSFSFDLRMFHAQLLRIFRNLCFCALLLRKSFLSETTVSGVRWTVGPGPWVRLKCAASFISGLWSLPSKITVAIPYLSVTIIDVCTGRHGQQPHKALYLWKSTTAGEAHCLFWC